MSSVNVLVEKFKLKYLTKRLSQHGLRSKERQNLDSMSVDLIDFLHDPEHYNQFALYLSNCYAQENLAFFETIIVFHHALLLSLQRNRLFSKKEYKHTFLNRLYSLKFNYLEQLNDEFIEEVNKGNIDDLSLKIYDTFICSSSDSSINISWSVRHELTQFFNAKRDRINISETETQLKSIYLDLFNSAILEIYGLLDTRYSTDFINTKSVNNA